MVADSLISGKHCLVTGAAGGIGSALARRLAAAGCRLFLTGRREAALQELADSLGNGPAGPVGVIAADLERDSDVDGLIDAIMRDAGGLDILVNNAGVFPVGAIAATTNESFDRCFAVNVRAPFLLTRAFAPGMAERGWGRIVNIGSSSSYAGFADTAAYCASKHALLGLSRSSHAEFKERGVLTISVSPGSVQTEMGRQVPGQDFSTFIAPDEIADWVAFSLLRDGNAVSEEIRLTRKEIR